MQYLNSMTVEVKTLLNRRAKTEYSLRSLIHATQRLGGLLLADSLDDNKYFLTGRQSLYLVRDSHYTEHD